MSFPTKYLDAPLPIDPAPEIFRLLTRANRNKPINGITPVSYLPDFTRAVEMESNAVYRVNVPGYFYRHQKDGAGPESTSKTGLVIGQYNYTLNSISERVHFYDPGSDNVVHEADDNGFISDKYQVYRQYEKNKDGGLSGYLYKKGSDIWVPSSYSSLSPSATLDGYSCFLTTPKTMRIGMGDKRDKGCNYFVATGKNNDGGFMNSLIPIIPGCASTTSPSGSYESSVPTSSGGLCADITSGYSGWQVESALGDIESGTINSVMWAKDNAFRCKYAVAGVTEAKGTYVAYSCEETSGPKFYFVPCKNGPTGVSSITKIRSVSWNSCNYNLLSGGYRYPNHLLSKAYSFYHEHSKSKMSIDGSQSTTSITVNWDGESKTKEIGDDCTPYVSGLSSAFSTEFTTIFDCGGRDPWQGFSQKFIAMTMASVPAYNEAGTWNPAGGHTVFNPQG